MIPLNRFKSFDVRELIRNGVEPCPEIVRRALRACIKMRNGRVAGDLAVLQGARRENILYGSSTDEQRSSSAKNPATRRAVFWRTPGGVAPRSQSALAMLLRRALPAARQKTARPFLILIQALNLKTDEGLVIIAPFLPSPMIERLGGQGFSSKVERGRGTDWMVYFWRENN